MNVTIACCLWDPNEKTMDFSNMYDERWVERLYRGFARNLTQPFEFVCWSDIPREFSEPEIQQRRLHAAEPDYGCLIEPFGTGAPTIICGLDTIVTGNVDHLARYCLEGERVAVPRDPFHHWTVCNAIALVPAGKEHFWRQMPAGANDMDWLRSKSDELAVIDDLWPGQVVSWKGQAKHYGPSDARIVYFHGSEKPHELAPGIEWIAEAWA